MRYPLPHIMYSLTQLKVPYTQWENVLFTQLGKNIWYPLPHGVGYTLLHYGGNQPYGVGYSQTPLCEEKGTRPTSHTTEKYGKRKYHTNPFLTYQLKLVMSRTRLHMLNESSITCKSHDHENHCYLYSSQLNNNRSMSPKNRLIEFNELSLLAVLIIAADTFECAKFKKMSVNLHLI